MVSASFMAPSSFRQVSPKLEDDLHERGLYMAADGSLLRSLCNRWQRLEQVMVLRDRGGICWGRIEYLMAYRPSLQLPGQFQAIGLFGATYELQEIISTRHGAAFQAVRQVQRKFRRWRSERYRLDQWPRMLEDVVAIARCYFHISSKCFRKSKIERAPPLIIVGSGAGFHEKVCGVPRAR